MKQLKPTMQFTDLCAMLLRELHDVEGKSQQDVVQAMQQMPFVSSACNKTAPRLLSTHASTNPTSTQQ